MPTWLIILIILIVAFGPIAWFVPSRRDKQLSTLRTAARQEGLVVDIQPLERLVTESTDRVTAGGRRRDTTRLIPRYGIRLSKRLRGVSPWRVLKGPATRPAIEVGPNWFFDPSRDYPPEQGWPASIEKLLDLINELPDGVRGVELGAQELAVFWSEPKDADAEDVMHLANQLKHLADVVQSLLTTE